MLLTIWAIRTFLCCSQAKCFDHAGYHGVLKDQERQQASLGTEMSIDIGQWTLTNQTHWQRAKIALENLGHTDERQRTGRLPGYSVYRHVGQRIKGPPRYFGYTDMHRRINRSSGYFGSSCVRLRTGQSPGYFNSTGVPQRIRRSPGNIDSTGVPQRIRRSPGYFNSTGVPQRIRRSPGNINSTGVPQRIRRSPGNINSTGVPQRIRRSPGYFGFRHPRGTHWNTLRNRTRRQEAGRSAADYQRNRRQRRPIGDKVAERHCVCSACDFSQGWDQGDFENVAYNARSDASSVYENDPSCAFVNGVFDTNAAIRPRCFHSGRGDADAWVWVDLRSVFTFDRIFITRSSYPGPDTHAKRRMLAIDITLDGTLLHSTPNYQQFVNYAKKMEITFPRSTGQFIRLSKRNEAYAEDTNEYFIVVCMLEIWVCKMGTYGTSFCQPCPAQCDHFCDNQLGCTQVLYNVAIMKPAQQSHVATGNPQHLLDGAKAGTGGSTCLELKRNDAQEWVWARVNLEQHYKVFRINITARVDCCGADYLRNFWILLTSRSTIGPTPPKEEDICYYHQIGVATGQTKQLRCATPLIGQYLWVLSRGKLGLCELQAFGHAYYYMPAGSRCDTSSKLLGCDSMAVCQNGDCKVRVTGACSETSDCEEGTMCQLGRCRLTYDSECNPSDEKCRLDAFCHPGTSKCKIKYGENCENNDQYCPPDALCTFTKCGKRVGEACETNSQCTAGASCSGSQCQCEQSVSTAEGGRCMPKPGRIGSSCQDNSECTEAQGQCQGSPKECVCVHDFELFRTDFSCRNKAGSECQTDNNCHTGQICEGSTCRLRPGQSCFRNEQYCVSAASCISTFCAFYPGDSCTGYEYLCTAGSTCVNGVCKLSPGQFCGNYTSHCEVRLVCSLADDQRCMIPGGESCSSENKEFCVNGTTCYHDEHCRYLVGQTCTTSESCIPGSDCSRNSRDDTLKCRMRLGDAGCQDDADCAGDYICSVFRVCSLSKGAECSPKRDRCLHGGRCTGGTCQCNADVANTATDKCEPLDNQIGGSCTETEDCGQETAFCNEQGKCQCAQGYLPQPSTLQCRAVASHTCANKSLPGCLDGLVCDTDGACALSTGERCENNQRGLCKLGSVCDSDYTCRNDIHHECSDNADCREGTQCDFTNRCKVGPGSNCRENSDCVAGGHCNDNGVCACTDGVTSLTNGGACAPLDGKVGGDCVASICDDALAVCNSSVNKCQCQPGYAGDTQTLTCAKRSGQSCNDDSECLTGQICDPASSKCSIDVGQLCDGGNEHFCATGLECDRDSTCRIQRQGDCSGDKTYFCKSGFFCDFIGRCNRGGFDKCNDEEENPCIAGAICPDGICLCDPLISTAVGVTCEPNSGIVGGTCISSCSTANTECVDGVCRCVHNLKPDSTFNCLEERIPVSTTGFWFWLGLSFVILLLLLIAISIIIFWIKKKREEEEEMAKAEERKKWEETLGGLLGGASLQAVNEEGHTEASQASDSGEPSNSLVHSEEASSAASVEHSDVDNAASTASAAGESGSHSQISTQDSHENESVVDVGEASSANLSQSESRW